MMLAVGARKLLRKVNVGFFLCTVVTFIWKGAESSTETSKRVSKYFGSSDHHEKDLWSSLLSSFIFSTLLKYLV